MITWCQPKSFIIRSKLVRMVLNISALCTVASVFADAVGFCRC